ncbi:MAG: tetratricopeptide repeat protein [Myxococcota bacterium]
MTARLLVVLLTLAGLSVGCQRRHARLPDVISSHKSFEETLRDADALYAKRPDAEAVRASIGVYESASVLDSRRVDGAIGVIRSVAWLMEHGAKEDRKTLAGRALAAGNQCQVRSPGTAQCNYWQAVARGIDGREHPSTGVPDLKRIIALLKKADEQEPTMDGAAPARVIALALVRAPGWPVGPGDPEEALAWAKKAVERAPDHPLNQLVLAECLAATGDKDGAKSVYAKAAEVAKQYGGPDGADWAQQAEAALKKLDQ